MWKKWSQCSPVILTLCFYVTAERRESEETCRRQNICDNVLPEASACLVISAACCSERQLSLTLQSSWTYLANHHNTWATEDVFCYVAYRAGLRSPPAPVKDKDNLNSLPLKTKHEQAAKCKQLSVLISNTAAVSAAVGCRRMSCSVHCMSSMAHLTGPELILCQQTGTVYSLHVLSCSFHCSVHCGWVLWSKLGLWSVGKTKCRSQVLSYCEQCCQAEVTTPAAKTDNS